MAKVSFFSVKDIWSDRRKMLVLAICIFLSITSWFLISLRQTYSTTLLVPVRYVNFPENKTLLNEVPDQLAINLSGSGFDLIGAQNNFANDTLVVNLDNLNISVYGGYQRGYLDPSIVSQDLQARLKGSLAINRVLLDSLNFLFDLKVARMIQVKPNVSFTLPPGFVQLDSISVEPAELEIYGALSILDTLKYVRTEEIQIGEISQDMHVSARISHDVIGKDAKVSNEGVDISITIDKLTEKTFLVEPQVRNIPDSLSLLSFPQNIEVSVHVPISRYGLVNENDFKIFLDYDELQENYLVLPIHLEKWPTYVEHVEVAPKQVEIVISLKE